MATPTPVAWVEIIRRRLSPWQQQQLLQPPDLLAVPPAVIAGCTHHTAEAHLQSFLLSVGSTASQVGATAWFVFHCIVDMVGAPLHCGERLSAAGHCSLRLARGDRATPFFCVAPSFAMLLNVCPGTCSLAVLFFFFFKKMSVIANLLP